jgi:serine/threonine protein kinase
VWKAADVWSAGVIMHILLFGQPPYNDNDQQQCFSKIRRLPYEIPVNSTVSAEAKEILRKVMVKDPLKRIKAKDVLQLNWFKKCKLLRKQNRIKEAREAKEAAARNSIKQASLFPLQKPVGRQDDVAQLMVTNGQLEVQDQNAQHHLQQYQKQQSPTASGKTNSMIVSPVIAEVQNGQRSTPSPSKRRPSVNMTVQGDVYTAPAGNKTSGANNSNNSPNTRARRNSNDGGPFTPTNKNNLSVITNSPNNPVNSRLNVKAASNGTSTPNMAPRPQPNMDASTTTTTHSPSSFKSFKSSTPSTPSTPAHASGNNNSKSASKANVADQWNFELDLEMDAAALKKAQRELAM